MLELKQINDHLGLLRVVWQQGQDNSLKTDQLERIYHTMKDWTKALVSVVVVVLEGDMTGSLLDLSLLYRRMNNTNLQQECTDYLHKVQSLVRVIHKMKLTVVQLYDGHLDSSYAVLGSNSDFRIATERASFGVRLNQRGITALGGESYVLARLERNIGSYLLMTNDTLHHRSMLAVNVCNYYLPSSLVPKFMLQLGEKLRLAKSFSTFLINELLHDMQTQMDWGQVETSPIQIHLENKVDYGQHDDDDVLGEVNWLFSKKSFNKIMEAVDSNKRTNKLSQKIVQQLGSVSYTALQLNFQLVNKVQQADNFDAALQLEFQLLMRSMDQEGQFQALKAYVKGETLHWPTYREEQGLSEDIWDNILTREQENKYFILDDTVLDKSILEKRNEKGQVELRAETMSMTEFEEGTVLGQIMETQELEQEWESSERGTMSQPIISMHPQEDHQSTFMSLLGNIQRSKSDYDRYLSDLKTVLRATLSRQSYILQNRFKYLIEQLRKTKVCLATYNNKKSQLDKQIDDDQILVDLQNESAKLSVYSQKLSHRYETLFHQWDALVDGIDQEKRNIMERKAVLDQINKENIKLITQKKELQEVLARLKAEREQALPPVQAQNSISGIQYQSEDQIQLNLKQSISQTMLHYADMSAEEINEYQHLQKSVRHYQSVNQGLKNQFIQQCRARLEEQQAFRECWALAVQDLQRFQKISASDGLQSSLLFTLKDSQKKQGTSQGQKFFSRLIGKQPSNNPDQLTRNLIHGTLKNLLQKQKQQQDQSQFVKQNFELIRNNFHDYRSNQILALLQINRKAINCIDKIYYDKEKQLQAHISSLQKLLAV